MTSSRRRHHRSYLPIGHGAIPSAITEAWAVIKMCSELGTFGAGDESRTLTISLGSLSHDFRAGIGSAAWRRGLFKLR